MGITWHQPHLKLRKSGNLVSIVADKGILPGNADSHDIHVHYILLTMNPSA